ncbi:MAG TPA: hypothetical protein VG028_07915 [Terriglobia bacterium]|nr:hypothetical protein [Terriglobia bacterium]
MISAASVGQIAGMVVGDDRGENWQARITPKIKFDTPISIVCARRILPGIRGLSGSSGTAPPRMARARPMAMAARRRSGIMRATGRSEAI